MATLRQVALTGNVPLAELIRTLRAASGIEAGPVVVEPADAAVQQDAPGWFDEGKIAGSLDIRPPLDSGVHPMGRVMSEIERLNPGDIYEVVTPFVPAPLLDIAAGKGFLTWVCQEAPDLFRTYFTRPG